MPIATLNELKSYYPARLIMQYRGKDRWTQLIQALVQEAWLDGAIQAEATCFDLDTAGGAQLDIIGRIVGVPRNIFGLDLNHAFFEFGRYDSSVGLGFSRYIADIDPTDLFSRYRTTATYTMSDFEMRSLIRLKILFNTATRTMEAIKKGLFELFSSGAGKNANWDDETAAWDDSDVGWAVPSGSLVDIVDNLDATCTFNVFQPYHNVMTIASYLNLLPKPMGIAATVNYL